jgi:GT2 family glycosyltransferase
MLLSIIIVNWNTRDYLAKCLQSIRANPPSANKTGDDPRQQSPEGSGLWSTVYGLRSTFEIIVVDNASADRSAAMVLAEFGNVTLIANERNLGYAEGNNQGIEASNGDYILLLNPDTEVKAGALDALLLFGSSHANAAAVGCRLVGEDLRVQRSCRSFPNPAGVFYEYTGLSRLFPHSRRFGAYRMTWFHYNREAEVDQPMGSCLLLSRKAVEDVGQFDTDFPIFFNEVDWCYRAKQKGWAVYFTPSAEVLHHGAAGTSQVKPEMVWESHRSLLKFYDKHYRKSMNPIAFKAISAAIKLNSFLSSRGKSIGR